MLRWMVMLLPVSAMWAQSVQRQAWTTEDGLPQNSVHAILQARNGYLWIATEGGAARFDGIRFAPFGTRHERAFGSDDLCCMAETADGAVWFGSADGVVRFREGQFERTGIPGAVTAMEAERDGSVLVLADTGLWRTRGLGAERVRLPEGMAATGLGETVGLGGAGKPGEAVSVAAQGLPRDATVLCGEVLLRERNGRFVRDRLLPAEPSAVVEDGAGRLWMQTRSGVLEIGRGTGAKPRSWRIGKELPGSRLHAVRGSGGEMVAATNRGAFVLHPEDGGVTAIPELAGTSVLQAFTDVEGDRWFGTDSEGLVVLRNRAVRAPGELRGETVTAVMEAEDGAVWVGTRDSGLRVLRDGRVETPAASFRLGSQVVLSLAPGRHGDVWVGTPEGLDHLEGKSVTHLGAAEGLPDDFVRSLLVDADGAVWVGTRRGVARWKDGRVERTLGAAEGLPSEVIGTMLRGSDGTLWIGTRGGLARIRGDRLERVKVRGTVVTSLAETRDGRVWVGTKSGGLSVLRDGVFAGFGQASLRLQMDALVPDEMGSLWMRNPLGVARARVDALEACAGRQDCDVEVRQYGSADGMASVEMSSDGHPSGWRRRDGRLLFATRRGLAVVTTRSLPVDRVPPPAVVEQMVVDDVPVPLRGEVRIGPGRKRFTIAYTGLSLAAPLQVNYRVRMEGFDRGWVNVGNRRTAEYTNLPAGEYRFVVEARNADGVWSVKPGELRFRIARPVYRQPWFYLLAGMLGAGAVYGMYWLHLRRVRREFAAVLRERNRIAREIHDTLAQDFVAVSIQIEVMAQMLRTGDAEAVREQMDATRELVREGIRNARESIWALRVEGAGESLPVQLRRIAERSSGRNLETKLSVTGAYRALPPNVEGEMLRIAREAAGNAERHAGATSVAVNLVYSEAAVLLTVSDDGTGFDMTEDAEQKGHFGLRGMRERAAQIGAELCIQSAPGEGTTVTLKRPG